MNHTEVHPGRQQQELGTGAARWEGGDGCTAHIATRLVQGLSRRWG